MSTGALPAVTPRGYNRESPVSVEWTAAVSRACPAVEPVGNDIDGETNRGRNPKRRERRRFRGVRPVTTNPSDWPAGQQRQGVASGQQSPQNQSYAGQQRSQQPGRQEAVPAVDIIENEGHLLVFVDLPGFTEEEISIRADENTVVLRADRTGEFEEGRRMLLNERTTHVERTIPLPLPVQMNGSRAVFENGVCKIVLPRASTDRYKKIEFND